MSKKNPMEYFLRRARDTVYECPSLMLILKLLSWKKQMDVDGFYKSHIYLPISPTICFRLSLQNYRNFTQILEIRRTIFWNPSPLPVGILRDSPSVLATCRHGSNWLKQLLLLEASLWKLKWTITSITRCHRVKFSFQPLKSIKTIAQQKDMLHPFSIEMLVISYQFTCDQIYRKL